MIIKVEQLTREYRSPEKTPGLTGAIRHLIQPQYKIKRALNQIQFQVDYGSFIGLIGANGAGKTTLLKILSGLLPPTSGNVSVLDEDPFNKSTRFRQNIALVMGQKAQLWWDLPARDAFELIRAIYQIDRKTYNERVGEFSKLLQVEKLLSTQIRRLSLGERMKMELIGALLHQPTLLFLDEPTIGLDIIAAERLRAFLKFHNSNFKTTIILTSHNLEDIETLCNRLIILQEGTIAFDDTLQKLDGTPLHQYLRTLHEQATAEEDAS